MVRKKNAQCCTDGGKLNHTWTTDRKPKIYDCYGVLEKTAWIWRIAGIFPFTIKGPIGSKKYEINKFYAVYGFLMCCASIGDCVFSMVQYSKAVRTKPEVSVQYATATIRTSAILLCMAIASIWRIFRHKEISEIVHAIVEQDLILEQMNCSLKYESNAKIIWAYVRTMLTTVLLLMAYEWHATNRGYGSLLIQWVFWTLPLVAQLLDLTIFVSLVGLLGLKFRALNEKISNVVMRTNSSMPKIIVTLDACAEILRRTAKAHYSICAVGKRINSFFNTTVIISVTTAFMIVSATLYYIFVEVQREGQTNYVLIGSYVNWEFIHSIPIIIIVAICNWTFHQSNHTGKLIHEIRVEKIDSRLYEAVKTFSLQLHHQKLEFNAGGFFPLNSTLIQTVLWLHIDSLVQLFIIAIIIFHQMVGNITTYLVILIQFQPKMDIDNQ